MKTKYQIAKEAYEEVLSTLQKYKDIINYDYRELEQKSNEHLFGIELQEKYGLDIDPTDIYSLDWQKFKEYLAIGWFGQKYNRDISWSDDGKQPVDELMLRISFPTGAYIFGSSWGDGDYPEDLFNEFFVELKSYGSKYSDSHNHSLYFSIENAKDVFNNFSAILKKYHEKNKVDAKLRKIKQLQNEIEKLA